LIQKVGGRPGVNYQDIIKLVNRKLKDHTGAYADHLTTVQLHEQQELLRSWSKTLHEAHRAGRAAQWLERWEEGTL
jgi:hypothetical protein